MGVLEIIKDFYVRVYHFQCRKTNFQGSLGLLLETMSRDYNITSTKS